MHIQIPTVQSKWAIHVVRVCDSKITFVLMRRCAWCFESTSRTCYTLFLLCTQKQKRSRKKTTAQKAVTAAMEFSEYARKFGLSVHAHIGTLRLFHWQSIWRWAARERKWERNIVCACVCVGEWMMKITFSVAFHCFVLLLLFFRLFRKHTTPEAVSVHIYAWSGRIHIATESSHSKHTDSVCMYGWEREKSDRERVETRTRKIDEWTWKVQTEKLSHIILVSSLSTRSSNKRKRVCPIHHRHTAAVVFIDQKKVFLIHSKWLFCERKNCSSN